MAKFRDKAGDELEPGKWYNFGGDVWWRYTGTIRHTFWARVGKTGKGHKASGPAGRDAISMALYCNAPSKSYAHYIGGMVPDDVRGAGW